MVEFAPATGGLALWMPHRDVEGDPPQVPLASTDGTTIRYGPGFAALPLPEQVGWVAHEVLHVALRHAQRMQALQQRLGDVDARLFNICADAIVNSALSHLPWLRLPARAVRLEQVLAGALELATGAEAALLEWDVERLYRAIDDRRASESGRRGEQQASAVAAREDGPRAARARALAADSVPDLLPDANPTEAPEAQAEHTRTWGERLLRAHAGDGEHSMLRALLADLPRLRTPWEQVLRTRLARALAQRPALSWSRPTRSWIANQGRAGPGRRLPWEPGTSATSAAPRLAVVLDVSGSIEDALLARFSAEIEAIARRCEAALVLVSGDDRVRQVVHLEAGRVRLPALSVNGGGGTDFAPLVEEADRHRPDIGVVLTDLQGPAAFRPRWPVVWAVPEAHAAAVVPFGRLLVLD
jgi:predicted metal-dependent peptidase